MANVFTIINNDRGISLIPTLIILFLGTLIGIAASTTSLFEVNIANNDKMYKQNFFRADGTNQEAAQMVENLKATSPNDLREATANWLTKDADPDTPKNRHYYLWEGHWCTQTMATNGVCDSADINAEDGVLDNTRYLVVDRGGVRGSTDITMRGKPFMHEMGIYGRYDNSSTRGRAIIETEYRIKF